MMRKNEIGFIENLRPFPYKNYENIDLNSLVVYSIDFLEKKGVTLNFENICITSFRLFPTKFSLIKYEKYPDAARINRALLQCRPKYQNLLLGDVRMGFELTKEGDNRVKKTKILLEKPNLQKNLPKSEVKRTFSSKKELTELKNKTAFKKFVGKDFENISVFDVYDLMDITPYTSKKEIKLQWENRFNFIKKDKTLLELFNFIKKKFKNIF